MGELQEVVTLLSHADVMTYIQSGNVLFTPRLTAGRTAGRADTAALAAELERAIADSIGVRARVVVLSCGNSPAACATTRIRVRRIPSSCMRCSCPRYPDPAWPPG
jgi:uncharacterized protein (DUF1697 family)